MAGKKKRKSEDERDGQESIPPSAVTLTSTTTDDLTEEAKERSARDQNFRPKYEDYKPEAVRRIEQQMYEQIKSQVGDSVPESQLKQFATQVTREMLAHSAQTASASQTRQQVSNLGISISELEKLVNTESHCPAAQLSLQILRQVYPVYEAFKRNVQTLEQFEKMAEQQAVIGNPVVYVQEVLEDGLAVVAPEKEGHAGTATLGIADALKGKIKSGDRALVNKAGYLTKILPPLPVRKPLAEKPHVTFANVGGLEEQIEEMKFVLDVFDADKRVRMQKLKVRPVRGVLLYGPTGTGKTLLAKAAANYVDANFFAVNTPSVISKYLGQSAQNVRELFEDARNAAPAILYFDEVTPIGAKRQFEAQDAEREVARTTEQFLAEMDGFNGNGLDDFNKGYVLVVGSTNFYGPQVMLNQILDEAFLRRFDKKIEVPPPAMPGKLQIVEIYVRGVPIEENVVPKHIASLIEDANKNATGSDIANISYEARRIAYKRGADKVNITDYMDAVNKYKSEVMLKKRQPEFA